MGDEEEEEEQGEDVGNLTNLLDSAQQKLLFQPAATLRDGEAKRLQFDMQVDNPTLLPRYFPSP